ncbi:MAG: hypothetical protein AB7F22_06835 [Reyranella sp.]|uniref:hypothetical protein n=1 Tax=Reyranella sp. TaxID=1929291 RepID=UPI003D147458
MKAVLTALCALGLVAASTAWAQRADRYVDPPIVRSFNWFSYVGGNDIREACGRDGRNRLRLIYNAIYDEQVRTYEVFLQPDGTAGLDIGVLADQGSVTNLRIGDAGDVLGPWRMRRGQRLLTPAETRELLALMQASNAFGPPRDGLRLPDVDFWWTVASCRGGVWGFQAYHHPTDGFANVKFAAKLFSFDTVPVPVNPPRKLVPAELRRDWNAPPNHWKSNQWTLTVGKDGLRPR